MVYEYDLRTDKSSWAGAIEEVTGYSFEEFQRFGKGVWIKSIHLTDMNSGEEKSQSLRKNGSRFREELRLRRKDGACIYVENDGIWLTDYEGQPYGAIGVLKDITERKETENFLKNIEIARKKEIHHRIKNNLQVISSLLDLQAEKFNSRECVDYSEILKAFRESQDRVTSIALIHEELHEGTETDKLNFSQYLERLVDNLFQTYRSGNADVRLSMDLEENIFFGMDTVVPLGIIINELVSNSLKYAFTDRVSGKIQIKLYRQKNTKDNTTDYILNVLDNGVGIPENVDFKNTNTLGLQLVGILVEQLDGEIELKKDEGTDFLIRFSVGEKEN